MGSHIVVAWQSAYYYQLKTMMGRAEERLLRVENRVDYFVRGRGFVVVVDDEDLWAIF